MFLSDISLGLNTDEYERVYRSEFGFHSRYLCNFVRRRIAKLRFRTTGFRKIYVQGCQIPQDACPIEGESVAVAFVLFDRDRYESLGSREIHEFFIDMLLTGVSRCASYHGIPLVEIRNAVDDFRQGGYRNQWTYKNKLLRPHGLRSSLNCTMDPEKFVLNLKLERKGVVVFDEPILETKPDETIFAYQFKDVVVEGDSVVVQDKFGRPTASVDLSLLS